MHPNLENAGKLKRSLTSLSSWWQFSIRLPPLAALVPITVSRFFQRCGDPPFTWASSNRVRTSKHQSFLGQSFTPWKINTSSTNGSNPASTSELRYRLLFLKTLWGLKRWIPMPTDADIHARYQPALQVVKIEARMIPRCYFVLLSKSESTYMLTSIHTGNLTLGRIIYDDTSRISSYQGTPMD